LLRGDFGLLERLRIDQVADRFGLGQINAAIQQAAHGELSGLGETRASGKRKLHNVTQNHGRTVRGDFDDVVGRVGVGRGEVGDNHFVNASVVSPDLITTRKIFALGCARDTRLNQLPKNGTTSFKLMLKPQHRRGNTSRFLPSQANYANAPASRRSSNGDDSVI